MIKCGRCHWCLPPSKGLRRSALSVAFSMVLDSGWLSAARTNSTFDNPCGRIEYHWHTLVVHSLQYLYGVLRYLTHPHPAARYYSESYSYTLAGTIQMERYVQFLLMSHDCARDIIFAIRLNFSFSTLCLCLCSCIRVAFVRCQFYN